MTAVQPWKPTAFHRFEKSYDTSMGTARIVTDAGPAYIKALGNRQGPHALACEWIATHLAHWFGLPTFEIAILRLTEHDEIPFPRGGFAQPGPAFVARAMSGRSWRGTPAELKALDNPHDLTRLVVFDTWMLNCDRHPPDLATRKPNYDNVFMAEEGANPGRFRLIAMDHTHCFTCGRDLTGQIASIDRVKDTRLYGLFPAFVRWLNRDVASASTERLRQLASADVDCILRTVPAEWQVGVDASAAVGQLISQRATFVAENIQGWLWPGELEF